MKIKTSELIGPALDWAAGECGGYELSLYGVGPSIRARVPGLGVHAPWRPTRYWNQGGPIIEREGIDTNIVATGDWFAQLGLPPPTERKYFRRGPTPLIAAMRCYVTSKLGDEVEIPDGLLEAAP